MEKYILCFLGGIIFYLFFIVCWNKLLGKKIDFKDYKLYLSLLILDLCGTTINFMVPQFIKIFCVILIFLIVNYIFFCRSITKNLLVVLFSEFIIVISELLFTLTLSLFMGESLDKFAPTGIGVFTINAGVGLVAFIFLKFKFIYTFYNYLVKTFDNMKKSNLMIYFVLTVVLIAIFAIIIHTDLPLTFLLICAALLTIFYIVMLFRLANARENYKAVINKYETSMNSLREYEEIMDRYRVTNHENKNQLLTIRNMINKKDKKTADYIDKLVDNKIKDNETIFNKTSKIPEGGFRAIIYSKLCKMDDMKIRNELYIANDVKTVDMLELGEHTTLNACKIIGVFLDNAIEAVESLNKKHIILEIFIMDDYLCFDITNNYKGKIEVDKLSIKGYTTKGRGHGYGLALVEEIIQSDANLKHENEISKDTFTQRLKIKM